MDRIVYLQTNNRMRTDKRTLAALDADVGIPQRDFGGDVALFPLRSSGRIGAVYGQALTGSISPSPAIIGAVTEWMKSGAWLGTTAGRVKRLLTSPGTCTSCK